MQYLGLPTQYRFNVGPASQLIAGLMQVNRLRRKAMFRPQTVKYISGSLFNVLYFKITILFTQQLWGCATLIVLARLTTIIYKGGHYLDQIVIRARSQLNQVSMPLLHYHVAETDIQANTTR